MSGQDIVESILNGHSLRVVLYPDTNLQHNKFRLVEALNLEHILLDGEKFWAMTHTASSTGASVQEDGNIAMPTSYGYSNYADVVFNFSYLSEMARIYPSSDYSRIRFVTIPNYQLVWKHGDSDTSKLRKCITQGCSLRVALLDEENYWNIHAVWQAIIGEENDWFEVQTHVDAFPSILRQTQYVASLSEEINQQKRGSSDGGRTAALLDNVTFHSCFYRIRGDGLFFGHVDKSMIVDNSDPGEIKITGARAYRDARVFSEIIGDSSIYEIDVPT